MKSPSISSCLHNLGPATNRGGFSTLLSSRAAAKSSLEAFQEHSRIPYVCKKKKVADFAACVSFADSQCAKVTRVRPLTSPQPRSVTRIFVMSDRERAYTKVNHASGPREAISEHKADMIMIQTCTKSQTGKWRGGGFLPCLSFPPLVFVLAVCRQPFVFPACVKTPLGLALSQLLLRIPVI